MGLFSYSSKNNIFYKNDLRKKYEENNSWPDDAIDVDDDVFSIFGAQLPPTGKVRGAGKNGLPVWVDAQTLSEQARLIRDGFIKATDNMVLTDYTINDVYLTTEQRQELFDTRLAFKRWTKQEGWPEIPLPTIPDWITQELASRNYTIPHWSGSN